MKRRRKVQPPLFDAEGYQTNLTDLNGTPLPDLKKVKARSLWGGARPAPAAKLQAVSPCCSVSRPRPSAASAPPSAKRARPSPKSPSNASSSPDHIAIRSLTRMALR